MGCSMGFVYGLLCGLLNGNNQADADRHQPVLFMVGQVEPPAEPAWLQLLPASHQSAHAGFAQSAAGL